VSILPGYLSPTSGQVIENEPSFVHAVFGQFGLTDGVPAGTSSATIAPAGSPVRSQAGGYAVPSSW
jgi:hypothetical protein